MATSEGTMKAGTKIIVTFPARLDGVTQERATVARVTKDMLPLPAGYVPVRFEGDSGTILVHSQYIAQ
jgi:hypothetical protein